MQSGKEKKASEKNNSSKMKSQPEQEHQERAVTETKQPDPSNQPIRKTDPSRHAFHDEEE